ncbi:MAG: ABC transporter substrate-binding protein [Candidatus Marinimicrobia bacterium]|nr:ABC transporter substrate-binding protein [Candidatus Neomarinimicrobiota bacterium]MCF7850910.1 ABC transporter substrate-binding protein [Candidatus Neomarinimicrobiota bacterium]MCF7905122.1 ABC transporter substrate-binding protein [Candidatus Neomarinimicrobiota bacterium]
MKISRWVTLLSMSILIMVGSCGNSENEAPQSDVVTITFWHSFVSSTVPALEKLIDRFHAEHPGIRIKAQYIPTGDALIQKLITSVQSNTAPDISWVHADYLGDLVEAKAIYKMDRFIQGPQGLSEEELRDIYPALLTYASWQDTLYSMPMEATNMALLYNKQLFREAGLDPEQPPKTWEEMYDYAKKLSTDLDGDGRFDRVGMFIPIFAAAGPMSGWMTWQWLPYLWQAGGYLVEKDQSKVLFNSDAGVAALTLWKKIFEELNLSTFTTDYDIAFSSGFVGMSMDGPWALPRFNKIFSHLDWAFAPLPAGPEKQATVAGGEYLTVFKQSAHPDEAWTFIKWIIQPQIQAFWAMESGYLPMRKSAQDYPEFKQYLEENRNFKIFVESMDHAQAQRKIDFYPLQINQYLAEAIEAATLGEQDPRTILDKAAEKSNKLLAKARSSAKQRASE